MKQTRHRKDESLPASEEARTQHPLRSPSAPRLRGLALGASLAVLFAAKAAGAYCRTTTTPLPGSSFDASNSGMCWTEGKALAWPAGMAIPYSLASAASSQVSLADATRIADASFAAWTAVSCPKNPNDVDGGSVPVDISAYDNGPVDNAVVAADCGLVTCPTNVHDTNHLIVFRDSDWSHNDATNTLALTTVTYGVNSGTIYDADIEINSTPPHLITATEPPPEGTYDLQSILIHEAGHFFGLAHAPDKTSIMYAFYNAGSIDLTQDDMDGVCAIYPVPKVSSGCALEGGPLASSSPWAAAMFAVVAWARKRRRSSARAKTAAPR